jgi:hypothetical protein
MVSLSRLNYIETHNQEDRGAASGLHKIELFGCNGDIDGKQLTKFEIIEFLKS